MSRTLEGHALMAPDEARRMRELARRRADVAEEPGFLDKAARTVGENPGIALGAALAIGVLLGWWVKR